MRGVRRVREGGVSLTNWNYSSLDDPDGGKPQVTDYPPEVMAWPGAPPKCRLYKDTGTVTEHDILAEINRNGLIEISLNEAAAQRLGFRYIHRPPMSAAGPWNVYRCWDRCPRERQVYVDHGPSSPTMRGIERATRR